MAIAVLVENDPDDRTKYEASIEQKQLADTVVFLFFNPLLPESPLEKTEINTARLQLLSMFVQFRLSQLLAKKCAYCFRNRTRIQPHTHSLITAVCSPTSCLLLLIEVVLIDLLIHVAHLIS